MKVHGAVRGTSNGRADANEYAGRRAPDSRDARASRSGVTRVTPDSSTARHGIC